MAKNTGHVKLHVLTIHFCYQILQAVHARANFVLILMYNLCISCISLRHHIVELHSPFVLLYTVHDGSR